MSIALDIHASNVAARLCLGSGLLFLSVMTQSILFCFILSMFCMTMIRFLDVGWLTVLRLLKLMQWFVLPILLLHALLSPGQLLMPDTWLPVTKEGLRQGVMLSLHLSAVFFAAMLMFRLLKRVEWLRLIVSIPKIGQRLLVYVWLMHSMQMSVRSILADLRWQFRLRKDLKCFPIVLMSAFQQTLAEASGHAAVLWLRWPEQGGVQQMMHQTTQRSALRDYMVSGLLVGVGVLAFLSPWLMKV